MGVHSVAYAFPKVQLLTTAVDAGLSDDFRVLPGVGNFGDRFYGTEWRSGDKVRRPRDRNKEEGDDDDEDTATSLSGEEEE